MIIRYFIQLLLIFLCTAPMVQGDDLGDVQNSFETTIRAFNTGNRDAFISSSHTDVVVYGVLSAEATRGKEAFQQLIRDFVATHGAIHFTPVNPAFRVAGTSALAWGHYIQRSTDQAGLQENFNGRYTFTYTKTDTGWKLVALYFSPLELSPSEAAAAAQTATASDLSAIQTSFGTTITAFNTGNMGAFISSSHTDVVVYGVLSAEATRGKEAFQQLIRDFVAAHGAIHFTPVNPAFRVAGTSALAWGHYIQRSTDQAGLQENFNGRYTFTYTKTDTGWKLVALYFSPLELSPSEAAAAAQTATASDLSAIQTSFGTTITAFNTGNMGAFISSSHTDVVVYGVLSAEATRGKEAFQQLIRDFVATHGAIHFTPVNPAFRVAGTSALAWGHYIQRSTDQAGLQENFNGRYTFTYTKTDTGWKLVALYFSPLL